MDAVETVFLYAALIGAVFLGLDFFTGFSLSGYLFTTKKGRQRRREREQEFRDNLQLKAWQRWLAWLVVAGGVAVFIGAAVLFLFGMRTYSQCPGLDVSPLMVSHKCWGELHGGTFASAALIAVLLAANLLWTSRQNQKRISAESQQSPDE